MTRVRKAVAVSLMTPMVGAAIAVGLSSHPAVAAEACPPLASASITPPAGTVTAGSSVHVSAKISGLMLLQAHLQISGPGLNKQVGKSVASGQIQGDVTVPKAGYFTLAVIGNGTSCTYQTAGFSAREQASTAKPTQTSVPSKNPRHTGAGGNASPGAMGPLPTGGTGSGSGAGANNFGLNPLNGASPFSLPSVAPDGSGQGFQYPSPDPQVAAPPPSQPQARNVSETTPIKWGQSLAVALVLLVISAHLGMWSRRQRLAAEGARSTGGKWMTRRKTKATPSTVAETTALADGATATATATTSTAPDTTAPITTGPSETDPSGTATTDTSLTEDSAADTSEPAVGSRSYQGRRRRS
ncbi:hypothetical protein GCM10027176_03550 [Actinoallomurus bryophytorum]|uniref:Ig-like domain-containing protein n=1 Tax=Actinoallomurus bryophytorum TaxID=1490222 RepID=A0A543CJT5_9ACTN|nr:hypothetical protein [Actinoallomurus bryophytorum]TQL97371.1 hypothetical protein FB559_2951 [Actinoallomurus bryophytorum]